MQTHTVKMYVAQNTQPKRKRHLDI